MEPRLCSRCRNINFNALLPPTESVIKSLRTGEHSNERPWALAGSEDGTDIDKIVLGSLNEIEARAAACELCATFTRILTSSATAKTLESPLRKDNMIFRADPDLSYYGRIFEQAGDGTHGFVLRRLALTGHLVQTVADSYDGDAFNETELYFDHLVQPCFSGKLSDQSGRVMPFGARARSAKIDIQLIKQWMTTCDNEHGRACPNGPKHRMDTFRAIDVDRRCIVVFRDVDISQLQYVALSYVWGGPGVLMLLKDNAGALQYKNALEGSVLPRTIRDSMEVVHLLGLRYLWIDALCIVQDSPEDKVEQISSMADIYTSAHITIVAATGLNANSGLPGVVNSRGHHAQQEVIVTAPTADWPGLSLVNCLKEYPSSYGEWYARGMEAADFNKWSTRGWCLQEGFLSVRRLTFTEEQVFWTCGCAYWCEESCFEIPGLRLQHFLPSVHKVNMYAGGAAGDPWQTFSSLVDNYTRRDLTFDGDAANAFGAVFKTFERRTGASFLWGLPRPFFELGLMWESDHGVIRRNTEVPLSIEEPERKGLFPSWSWLGWRGQSSCKVTSDRLEMEKPSVACFVLTSDSPARLMHVAAHDGSHVVASEDIAKQAVSMIDLETSSGFTVSDLLARWPIEYMLFFHTTSARLQVDSSAAQDPTTFAEYAARSLPKIRNARGEEVGSLCRTRAETWSRAKPDGRNEFIEVGRRLDPELPPEIVPPRVLVLQISRDASGVAYRVNYGEVDLHAWEEAQPQRVLVALA